MRQLPVRPRALGDLLLATGWLLLLSAPARAATWYPELKAEARYDDNVLHQPVGSDDLLGVFTPELALRHADAVSGVELLGRRTWTTYSRTNAGTSISDLASARIEHRPSEFTSFTGTARYVQSLDPLDFVDGAVVTRGDVASTLAGARLELFQGEASGRLRRWEYASADFHDGRSYDWSLRAFPYHTRVTRISAGAERQHLEIADQTLVEIDLQTVGIRRRHTERLWTEIEGGRAEIARNENRFREVRPAGAIRLGYTGGSAASPIVLRLEAADAAATTVSAALSGGGAGRAATLSWENLLDVEGGIYRSATLSRRGTLELRDTLLSGTVLAGSGSYARIRPFKGDGPQVDVTRASASITQPLAHWVAAVLRYDFIRQDAPVGSRNADFNRNRIGLALVAGPRVSGR